MALNDKLPSRQDLLQSLVGYIVCLRENEIALSARIEAIILQVVVPRNATEVYNFSGENIKSIEWRLTGCTGYVFAAKSSPKCANHTLHQVAKYVAKRDEIFVKTVQGSFYINDFFKSVRTVKTSSAKLNEFDEMDCKLRKCQSQIAECAKSANIVVGATSNYRQEPTDNMKPLLKF